MTAVVEDSAETAVGAVSRRQLVQANPGVSRGDRGFTATGDIDAQSAPRKRLGDYQRAL